MDPLLACVVFLVGLAFGSFLNVCISRIPHALSIISPPSYCPQCRAPIRWSDNIPVLSWLMLRGRCRQCGHSISLRYPAVELLTAVLFVASYAAFGLTAMTLKACVFCFLVVGLIFMDAETGLLPREFTWIGIALGLVFAWVVPVDASGTVFLMSAFAWHAGATGAGLSLLDAALAAILGAAFFYLAWALYYLARKREGMGLGDIAMIAMASAFLGLKLTVLVVFFSPILATLYAFSLLFVRSSGTEGGRTHDPSNGTAPKAFLSREIPFGVFLGSSALLALFLGQQIWSWYLSLFR